MQYKPYWQRIFFLAILLHFFILSAFAFSGVEIISKPAEEIDAENLEWIDIEVEDLQGAENLSEEVEEENFAFPELNFAPIYEPAPQKNFEVAKNISAENLQSQKVETEKVVEEDKKLKVLSKIFPKDVFGTLAAAGLKTKPTLDNGKVVVEITVTTKGTASNAKVISSDASAENKNAVQIVSEMAAAAWTFEPFKDATGNLQEMKTQIEFLPTDF